MTEQSGRTDDRTATGSFKIRDIDPTRYVFANSDIRIRVDQPNFDRVFQFDCRGQNHSQHSLLVDGIFPIAGPLQGSYPGAKVLEQGTSAKIGVTQAGGE